MVVIRAGAMPSRPVSEMNAGHAVWTLWSTARTWISRASGDNVRDCDGPGGSRFRRKRRCHACHDHRGNTAVTSNLRRGFLLRIGLRSARRSTSRRVSYSVVADPTRQLDRRTHHRDGCDERGGAGHRADADSRAGRRDPWRCATPELGAQRAARDGRLDRGARTRPGRPRVGAGVSRIARRLETWTS